jgi:hypothetical protein
MNTSTVLDVFKNKKGGIYGKMRFANFYYLFLHSFCAAGFPAHEFRYQCPVDKQRTGYMCIW